MCNYNDPWMSYGKADTDNGKGWRVKYCCTTLMLTVIMWVKISADTILKYFSYFSQKIGFHLSCKLSPKTVCMKCQNLFSWKKKKNIINLWHAESAERVIFLNVKDL